MHLIKSPSGILHFRMRIPKKAQPYFQNRREIKQSLLTKKKRIAQPIANQLYERNMTVIRNLLYTFVDGSKVDIDHGTIEEDRKTLQMLRDQEADNSATIANTNQLENLPELAEQHLTATNPDVVKRTQTEKIRALKIYLCLHTEINHLSANAYSDLLKKLPPRASFETKEDLIKLSEQSHKTVITGKTHNKNISAMSGWNTWLIRRGHLKENYFSGLMTKRNKRADEERPPYTPEEIALVLRESSELHN